VGGTVRALVTLASTADLEELGSLMLESGLAMFVLGNGSNLLVADGEHDVLGVHLVGEFEELRTRDEGGVVVVDVGAGLDLPIAARRLAKSGVVGFEWAVGVPGSFGGAAVMNAGGHGSDISESLVSVTVWNDGVTRTWSKELLDYGYRTSALRGDDLVTALRLHLRAGDSETAQERIREIVRWRREHQPGGANAGSSFRNPEGDFAGRLIEAAGCKGMRLGTAVVSEKHANFIIADADGRANDVYELLTTVRALVRERTGVELVCEHRFLGFGAP
jgi:UDP-N-acetylmuramate dehydrogenase